MKKLINKLLMLATEYMPARAIDLDGKYYIERYHVIKIGKLHVLLHRYLGSDGDREVHSHPWKTCVGIPLCGGYTEERVIAFSIDGWKSRMVNIRPWRWNLMGPMSYHRVAHVEPGTWTMFITWNKFNDWLFAGKVNGGVYLYQSYDIAATREWWKTADKGWLFRHKRGTF
jgi:hypothetical protein